MNCNEGNASYESPDFIGEAFRSVDRSWWRITSKWRMIICWSAQEWSGVEENERTRLPKPRAIPTAGEFRLLEILWRLGEGTIEDFLRASDKDDPLNYKTVQTVLRIYGEQEICLSLDAWASFCVSTSVKRNEVSRTSLRSLQDRIFSRLPPPSFWSTCWGTSVLMTRPIFLYQSKLGFLALTV